jgi:hypothetical protein
LETFNDAHDRFVIIDGNDIYHIGASLKDLGKKFSLNAVRSRRIMPLGRCWK